MVSPGVSPKITKASKYRIIGLFGRTISPASGAIYTQKSLLDPDFIDLLRALRFVGLVKFVPYLFPKFFSILAFCYVLQINLKCLGLSLT